MLTSLFKQLYDVVNLRLVIVSFENFSSYHLNGTDHAPPPCIGPPATCPIGHPNGRSIVVQEFLHLSKVVGFPQ